MNIWPFNRKEKTEKAWVNDELVGVPFKIKHHDPNDHRPGPWANDWEPEKYCRFCGKAATHNEYMTEICTGCGHHGTIKYTPRCKRLIWINDIRTIQYLYRTSVVNYRTSVVNYDNKYISVIDDKTPPKEVFKE